MERVAIVRAPSATDMLVDLQAYGGSAGGGMSKLDPTKLEDHAALAFTASYACTHVSERALLSAGELRGARKRLLAERFAATPRLNRHQQRVAKARQPKGS